jgi:hypothetical protein
LAIAPPGSQFVNGTTSPGATVSPVFSASRPSGHRSLIAGEATSSLSRSSFSSNPGYNVFPIPAGNVPPLSTKTKSLGSFRKTRRTTGEQGRFGEGRFAPPRSMLNGQTMRGPHRNTPSANCMNSMPSPYENTTPCASSGH